MGARQMQARPMRQRRKLSRGCEYCGPREVNLKTRTLRRKEKRKDAAPEKRSAFTSLVGKSRPRAGDYDVAPTALGRFGNCTQRLRAGLTCATPTAFDLNKKVALRQALVPVNSFRMNYVG